METSTIIRRSDGLSSLQKLLPLLRTSALELHNLAQQFSTPGWRDLFIRYWQQDEQCLAEVQHKIREMGGVAETESREAPIDADESDEEPSDPLLADKSMLLRCLNQKTQILQAYTDIRRNPLSFDIRMLLQRHQLQAREVLERLSAIYLAYPTRSARPMGPESHYPYHRA